MAGGNASDRAEALPDKSRESRVITALIAAAAAERENGERQQRRRKSASDDEVGEIT